ncbi:hypothetical protein FB45DRAFT_1037742 [Roridomyces roridus]|uniref:Uncharacterized protein n=1 Tax=Roridomyces roridus TaxID=1738132 RepID=A0AAD7FCH7_9AGAR|nr:hypothetical protein FB45DRAFT_1037742 [Roridomyces roridus]
MSSQPLESDSDIDSEHYSELDSEPDFGDLLAPSSEAGSDYVQLESQKQESERTEQRRRNRWLELVRTIQNQLIPGYFRPMGSQDLQQLSVDELRHRCVQAEADRSDMLRYCTQVKVEYNRMRSDLSQTKRALRAEREELESLPQLRRVQLRARYDIEITEFGPVNPIQIQVWGGPSFLARVNSDFSIQAANLLPRACTVNLVLSQVSPRWECWQTRARKAGKQELCGLIVAALLAHLEDICDVGHAQEILRLMKPVGIRICQLQVNLGFPQRLAWHLQEANEIIWFIDTSRDDKKARMESLMRSSSSWAFASRLRSSSTSKLEATVDGHDMLGEHFDCCSYFTK